MIKVELCSHKNGKYHSLLRMTIKNPPLNIFQKRWQNSRVTKSLTVISDRTWPIYSWIESERDFSYHHLRETWNLWLTFLPIFCDFKWNTCQFHHENGEIVWIGWEQEFMSKNWSQIWFCEIIKIAFEHEFPWNNGVFSHQVSYNKQAAY